MHLIEPVNMNYLCFGSYMMILNENDSLTVKYQEINGVTLMVRDRPPTNVLPKN